MVDQACMVSNSNTWTTIDHRITGANPRKATYLKISMPVEPVFKGSTKDPRLEDSASVHRWPGLDWTGLRLAAYLAARAEQSRRKWDEEERDEDSRHPHSPSDWITLMYPSCVARSIRVARKPWKNQEKSYVNWTDDTVKSWEPWKPREASGVALSEIRGKMALMPRVSN